MVGVCAVLFGRAPRGLDADAVARRLECEVQGFRPGQAAFSADGRAALIEDAAHGDLYLVVQRGTAMVSRRLSRKLLKETRADDATLSLRLRDFTLRRAVLGLGDAQTWRARLEELA